jgi:CheY-like chemotaxis protein
MHATARQRILVADDNEDAVKTFALLLSFSGHEVRVARDGIEALEVAREFRPDVAFLDIGMPNISGYGVAEALRAEDWAEDMQLVAVTGWSQESDRQRAVSAGFDRHMLKPLDPTEVDRVLRELAKHRRQ